MRLVFVCFLFIGSLLKSQIPKDTFAEMKYPDCTEFNKKDKEYYEQLIEESKEIDYSGLANVITNNIDTHSFKTPTLKLYIRKIKTICGNEIDFSVCSSNINTTNPLYNESNFWSEKSIKNLSHKLNKNLIFAIKYYGFGNAEIFLNEETYSDRYVSKELRKFIINQQKGNYDGRDFYYIPSERKVKTEVEKADYLSVHFTNHLKKIVVVKYNINGEDIYKTFQYENKKWNVIDNKDEFKFIN
jgi:hypothetical protein